MANNLYNIYSTRVIYWNRGHLDMKLDEPEEVAIPRELNLEHVSVYGPYINPNGTANDQVTTITLNCGKDINIITPFEQFRKVIKSFYKELNKLKYNNG
jgi:hypothetical protein